ncbi:MAG: hypothetical protein ACR2HQ_05770 [Ilumatobacteraceae bacterium]
MSSAVPADYARFVRAARLAGDLPAAPDRLAAGVVTDELFVAAKPASDMLQIAAKRAAGLFRPTKRTEVVWVEGDSELAVGFAVRLEVDDGLLTVVIPVRCDQTGEGEVEVVFAVGSPDRPAGLFASTFRKPSGPRLVVDTWSDALVAFAWQSVLGMVSGLAGAIGKDARGNVLVPVELAVSGRGVHVVPMARHRFAGSSGLLTKPARR